jgi:hypothetical protein
MPALTLATATTRVAATATPPLPLSARRALASTSTPVASVRPLNYLRARYRDHGLRCPYTPVAHTHATPHPPPRRRTVHSAISSRLPSSPPRLTVKRQRRWRHSTRVYLRRTPRDIVTVRPFIPAALTDGAV